MPRITARRALTDEGWRDDVTVDVEDGMIVAVGPAERVAAGSASPEGRRGSTDGPVEVLVPGFVDLQVNGIGEVDVARADGDDWDVLARHLAAQGVTTWCPTLVTSSRPRYGPALDRVAAAMARPGPRPAIAGVHLEGPFLGGAPGAHPPALLQPIDLAWLDALPAHVAVVTLAPELDDAAEAVALLSRRGVLVALGHSTATHDQFAAAVEAGARLVTHLYNGMSGLHHRSPGLAAFALTEQRVTASLIADGVHVDPLMMRLAWQARPDGIVLVTDAVAVHAGTIGSIGMAERDGAPRLPDGTLAGSVLSMDAAVRRTVEACGVDVAAAVAAASTRPAALLGLHDRGVIAPGKRADLVALTADLHVAQTWALGTPLL